MAVSLTPPKASSWGRSAPSPRIVGDLATRRGRSHGAQERVLRDHPFYQLLHFTAGRPGPRPRVAVIAPLSGVRPQLLYDMLTDLLQSYDLHLLVWKDPAEIPVGAGPFDLDDNIAAVIDAQRALGPGVHLIGLCQSALPALAAASVLASCGDPAQPESLVLIGGKLDTRINPTRLDQLTRSHSLAWFEQHAVRTVAPPHQGAGRLVYPVSIQETALLAYFQRHLLQGGELFNKLRHDDGADAPGHPFIDLLLSPVDVPGEFFLDTVARVFHGSMLAEGRLRWRGVAVDPSAITRASLMTIEAEHDDIAAPGQTSVAHALCASIAADRRGVYLQNGIGHFGLFHGAVWHGAILPRLDAFLQTAVPR